MTATATALSLSVVIWPGTADCAGWTIHQKPDRREPVVPFCQKGSEYDRRVRGDRYAQRRAGEVTRKDDITEQIRFIHEIFGVAA
jgi:hypothetical protein